MNLICHFKGCFFSHGLDLAHQLPVEAFLHKLRSQIRIQDHGHGVVSLGYIALRLCHIDQKVLSGEHHLSPVKVKGQGSLFI